MSHRRHILLLSLGLALCGWSAPASGQGASGPAVLYTSNSTDVVQTALDAIARQLPDIKVAQVTGGTGVLMKRIEAEAAQPGGDVFWSGGFGTLGAYTRYFDAYASPQASHIPAALHGPQGLWIGTNVHVMAIMANADRVGADPLPKTWTDLFDPRWRGRVAMTDPNNSSFTYIVVYGLMKKYGLAGLKRLAANLVITDTTGQTNKGVSDGEYALGITSEAAAYEYIAAEQPGISLIYPKDGAILSPEGVVLIKGARHPEAARRLYDAFLSKDLQESVQKATYRRPSRTDIKVSDFVKLPELSDIALLNLDQDAAARERNDVLAAWKLATASKP